MNFEYFTDACVACGQPVTIAVDYPRLLCGRCLLLAAEHDPAAAAQRARVEEQLRLVAELGMPPDGRTGRAAWPLRDLGREWDGYVFELFGLQVASLPTPRDYPHFRLTFEGVAEMQLVLYLRRVRYRDLPAVVEARWHPARGETVLTRGVERLRRKGDLALVERGYEMLQVHRGDRFRQLFDERGRKRGTANYTQEELRERLPLACATVARRTGRAPTQSEVAAELGVSTPTLKKYLADYRVDWHAVKQGRRA